MKWQTKFVFALLLSTVVLATAKHPVRQKKDPPESWVDPSTGLMWTGKDNGRDINWRKATKYCGDLRLGGYADWRLATIEELEGIYDGTANAPGQAGRNGKEPFTWHVKGNLFLTGHQWSSTRVIDIHTGRPGGFVWYFDFWNKVKESEDGTRFSGRFAGYGKRALCVRSTGK